jgi:hypothetical protein
MVLTLYIMLWTKLYSFSYVSFSGRAILVELSTCDKDIENQGPAAQTPLPEEKAFVPFRQRFAGKIP